ncbi:MAG: Trk system potassium transporter TrkA [Clostridia bacterium]|jgi:trk system potassium uptake protein TrkA|nr:Trk system potassium transporter TrkA [Clostridia bacterium]
MRIIVIGAGKVGYTLAEHLTQEEHDVTVIDKSDEVIEHCSGSLDVICLKGNGANAKVLLEAGVDKANIVIASTESDESNMLACLIAKRLGARYTICRIRDPEFNESQTFLQNELGIDVAINPERATALEISRLLRYPFAGSIESFARGLVEMVEFRALEKDRIIGIPMKDLHQKVPGLPRILYAMVERNGSVIIPDGNFAILPNDKVFVSGDMVTITEFFRFLGRNNQKVRSVMVLGGGRISYYLSRIVVPMGIHVTLFELNPEKARRLSELLPKVDVVLGDGTDQELLQEQGVSQADAFIALSNRDEENLLTALYASRSGVPKTIAKNSRMTYMEILNDLGLDSVISPPYITTSTILRYVRARENGSGTHVERLYRLIDGNAEALEFIARKGDPYIGIPLKDLTSRKGSLVSVIVHQGKIIIPFGNDRIEEGDHVVVISSNPGISDLNEVLYR